MSFLHNLVWHELVNVPPNDRCLFVIITKCSKQKVAEVNDDAALQLQTVLTDSVLSVAE